MCRGASPFLTVRPPPPPGLSRPKERQAVPSSAGHPGLPVGSGSRVGSQCPDREWLLGCGSRPQSGHHACWLLQPPQAGAEDRASGCEGQSHARPGQSAWGRWCPCILRAAGRSPDPRGASHGASHGGDASGARRAEGQAAAVNLTRLPKPFKPCSHVAQAWQRVIHVGADQSRCALYFHLYFQFQECECKRKANFYP